MKFTYVTNGVMFPIEQFERRSSYDNDLSQNIKTGLEKVIKDNPEIHLTQLNYFESKIEKGKFLIENMDSQSNKKGFIIYEDLLQTQKVIQLLKEEK